MHYLGPYKFFIIEISYHHYPFINIIVLLLSNKTTTRIPQGHIAKKKSSMSRFLDLKMQYIKPNKNH